MEARRIEFETSRLCARRIGPDDADAMLGVYGDPQAMRFVGDGKPLDRAGVQAWIEKTQINYARRGYGMLALEDRTSGNVIGFCGLVHPGDQAEPEIKYAFRREWWGQGLATEAAVALLAFGAKVHGLAHVIATTDPGHVASHRVLRKAGLQQGALVRDPDGDTLFFHWPARPDGA